MKGFFRQSMAWLHTWAGLLCGWLLFFIFLTGTLGYFDTEIDYWMRPELPQRVAATTAAEAIALAERRIADQAQSAERFIIYPPSGRDVAELSLFWRSLPDESGAVSSRSEVLDRVTGLPIEARATGGGAALYEMHYLLHYLPSRIAYWLVGVCTMFMLVAIITGVITHKKIFRDFFTFRPRKGQRSWLDAHNVLSVLALPFHLMITYSGLIFFCFTHMPLLVVASYGAGGDSRQAFFDDVFRNDVTQRSGVAAPLASLASIAAEAEGRWGVGQIRSLDVRNAGDANARVFVTRAHVTPTSNGEHLAFDGVSGVLLDGSTDERSGAMLVNDTMMSLHEGLFAGTPLRWLYFLSGVLGTAMVGTGLVLWTAKRRKAGTAAHAGLALVERLNIGTVAGLLVAVGAYFWANRLLPLDLPERAAWELHALFIVWALMLVYAAVRPLRHAWRDQLGLAGVAFTLLPVLNLVTTQRHLGVSVPAGDWIFAGFDLTALAFGLCFVAVAWSLRRRERQASHGIAAESESPEDLRGSVGAETA